ncbi:hypothetical protein ACH518_04635 [Methylomonas sp. HW2-6]|uniref:hypothetical protein n=1 Tax=Methylomonas sp. HW2-6 TaxID=3376687 RepID=UPI00404137E9
MSVLRILQVGNLPSNWTVQQISSALDSLFNSLERDNAGSLPIDYLVIGVSSDLPPLERDISAISQEILTFARKILHSTSNDFSERILVVPQKGSPQSLQLLSKRFSNGSTNSNILNSQAEFPLFQQLKDCTILGLSEWSYDELCHTFKYLKEKHLPLEFIDRRPLLLLGGTPWSEQNPNKTCACSQDNDPNIFRNVFERLKLDGRITLQLSDLGVVGCAPPQPLAHPIVVLSTRPLNQHVQGLFCVNLITLQHTMPSRSQISPSDVVRLKVDIWAQDIQFTKKWEKHDYLSGQLDKFFPPPLIVSEDPFSDLLLNQVREFFLPQHQYRFIHIHGLPGAGKEGLFNIFLKQEEFSFGKKTARIIKLRWDYKTPNEALICIDNLTKHMKAKHPSIIVIYDPALDTQSISEFDDTRNKFVKTVNEMMNTSKFEIRFVYICTQWARTYNDRPLHYKSLELRHISENSWQNLMKQVPAIVPLSREGWKILTGQFAGFGTKLLYSLEREMKNTKGATILNKDAVLEIVMQACLDEEFQNECIWLVDSMERNHYGALLLWFNKLVKDEILKAARTSTAIDTISFTQNDVINFLRHTNEPWRPERIEKALNSLKQYSLLERENDCWYLRFWIPFIFVNVRYKYRVFICYPEELKELVKVISRILKSELSKKGYDPDIYFFSDYSKESYKIDGRIKNEIRTRRNLIYLSLNKLTNISYWQSGEVQDWVSSFDMNTSYVLPITVGEPHDIALQLKGQNVVHLNNYDDDKEVRVILRKNLTNFKAETNLEEQNQHKVIRNTIAHSILEHF